MAKGGEGGTFELHIKYQCDGDDAGVTISIISVACSASPSCVSTLRWCLTKDMNTCDNVGNWSLWIAIWFWDKIHQNQI
jgi:hypothetical protein